jgi:hypothetical protein
MHRPPLDQLVLLALQDSVLVALVVRIWWTGLFRTYPYFSGYLLLNLIQRAVLSAVPFDSRLYVGAWVATEGVIACLYAFVVLELYRVILRDFEGIASVSRRYVKVTLALAILVSLMLLGLEETPANMVSTVLLFERAVALGLLLSILLLTAFLAYYPVPLNRNLVVYMIGYAVFFLTKATALFIRNSGHYWSRYLSTVLIAVYTVCLLFWLFGLTRRGETRTMVIGHKWKQEDEERLLSQLRIINANLLKQVKK